MEFDYVLKVETDEGMGFDSNSIVADHIMEALRSAGDAGIHYELNFQQLTPCRDHLAIPMNALLDIVRFCTDASSEAVCAHLLRGWLSDKEVDNYLELYRRNPTVGAEYVQTIAHILERFRKKYNLQGANEFGTLGPR